MWKFNLTLGIACLALGAQARDFSLDLTGSNGGLVRRAAFAGAAASEDTRVVREHRLAAGAARVTGLEVGDRIVFQLFADKELTVTLTEEMPALEGRSFLGATTENPDFNTVVVLETADGLVLDVTDPLNNRVWQVASNDSGVTVREMTPEERPAGACGTEAYARARKVAGTWSTYGDEYQYPLSSTDMPNETVGTDAAVKSTQDATVRILVCFDQSAQGYVSKKGTTTQAFAQKSVDKMNAALANTGLLSKFRFVLAGVFDVPADAGGNIEKLIYYVDGEKTAKYKDYDWKAVRAKRAAVKADIATVLSHNSQDAGTVGIGDSLYEDAGDCGYNCCLIKFVDQDHTMTHECGHNMGAGHDLVQGDNSGPQYFSYSSGYYFTVNNMSVYDVDGQKTVTQNVKCHTIMAYDYDVKNVSHPCEVPCFSSPNFNFFDVTVGTADKNDNSRTIAETYKLVAQNHVTASSTAASKASDVRSARWTTSSENPCRYVADADYEIEGLGDRDDEDDDDDCLELEDGSWIETGVDIKTSHTAEGEEDLDFFVVMPDGGTLKVIAGDPATTNVVEYTGEVDEDGDYEWEEVALPLPAGQYTLKFLYESATGDEDDCCYLDEITFNDDVNFPDEVVATNAIVKTAVPYDWIDQYYPDDTYISYEDRARRTGDNGFRVWESYAAGLDPTNETSKFETTITMTNGVPKIEWTPNEPQGEDLTRTYTVYGKYDLTNAWEVIAADQPGTNRFFKVSVEAK